MITSFILKDLTTEREILFDQNGSFLLNANKSISLILPPISTQDSLYKTKRQIGKTLANKSIDTRPINIIAHTWAFTEDELTTNKNTLNSFINPLHEFQIIFPNGRYLIFTPDSTVRYTETIPDNNDLFCKFAITGMLYDPLLYDVDETTIRAKYLTSNFALPISFSVADPFTFSGLTNSSTIDVINYGDVDVGMIFEITSSSESINFVITNLETQEYIKINTTIVAGDLIVIDTRVNHRSIKKYNSGVITNYYKYLDSGSSWLTLEIGGNTFTLSADSGDAALGFSIKYRNAYYGVEQKGLIVPPVVTKRDVSGVTAKAQHVLSGYKIVDENGEVIGSMPNRGAVFGEATPDVLFVIPQGFHNGLGVVTAAGGGAVANSIIITEVDANKRITKVDVSSCNEIYPYMFWNYDTLSGAYRYLVDVLLSTELTAIGNYAFYYNGNLEITTLPSGLETIGSYAFQNCAKIALTSLPSGLTSIGMSAFRNCTALALASLPMGITSIETYTFCFCTHIALTSLPSGITAIGASAFSSCTLLNLTDLPSGLVSIGSTAFSACTTLRKIWIPNSCTTITASAYNSAPFYQCNSALVLYCEAASKPAGWNTYWNYYSSSAQLTVNWGVTKEAFDAL